MHPREFIAEYVDPAIASWHTEDRAKHLAVSAISQLDVLADIVFNQLEADPSLPSSPHQHYALKLLMQSPGVSSLRGVPQVARSA